MFRIVVVVVVVIDLCFDIEKTVSRVSGPVIYSNSNELLPNNNNIQRVQQCASVGLGLVMASIVVCCTLLILTCC